MQGKEGNTGSTCFYSNETKESQIQHMVTKNNVAVNIKKTNQYYLLISIKLCFFLKMLGLHLYTQINQYILVAKDGRSSAEGSAFTG